MDQFTFEGGLSAWFVSYNCFQPFHAQWILFACSFSLRVTKVFTEHGWILIRQWYGFSKSNSLPSKVRLSTRCFFQSSSIEVDIFLIYFIRALISCTRYMYSIDFSSGRTENKRWRSYFLTGLKHGAILYNARTTNAPIWLAYSLKSNFSELPQDSVLCRFSAVEK